MSKRIESIEITIDLGNAAFGDEPGVEVARILRDLAKRCEESPTDPVDWTAALRDINGNKVGSVAI